MNTNAKIAIGFVGFVILIVIVFVILAIGSPAAAVELLGSASSDRGGDRQ